MGLRDLNVCRSMIARGKSRDLIDPPYRVAQNLGLLLEVAYLSLPGLGDEMAAGFVGVLVQPLRQRDAVIKSPETACQRARQILIKGKPHELGSIGVPDMATIPNKIAVLDFPHYSVAIGASEH